MRKIKQISLMAILGFSVLQASKASGIRHDWNFRPIFNDSTSHDTSNDKNFVVLHPVSKNNPKKGFTDLFTTAVIGNDISGAKLNPMAVSFVQKYISKNSRDLLKMKKWGKPYLDLMNQILSKHGLPKEMKYLAVIESDLKSNARSWAGAVGPWAFMPETGRKYGLRISGSVDERIDYFKSTHAAARYLTDLYARYSDWLLVIAAYNSGAGNVDKAIRRSGGSKDFWKIQYYLPNESMNHVKKFIATHYIMEGEGGITTLTKNEINNIKLNKNLILDKEEKANLRIQTITGRYHSMIITKYLAMDNSTFYKYNPDFDTQVALNGFYELRLPSDMMNVFLSNKTDILNESMQVLLKQTTGTLQ